MKASKLGEFGLIARLAARIGAEHPPELVLGIGDDAAAWRSGDDLLLATTDTLVEGVHFLPRVTPWTDVGWKALAVNLSDIAAMGGEPLFALVTLALPPKAETADVDALYDGLLECARGYGVTIAGGDIVRAAQFSITVALIGRATRVGGEPRLLRRDAARPGDAIAITGTFGDSAAGLRRLREGTRSDDPLVRRHLRPTPRLTEGRAAVSAGIRCGIDISDGLLQDLGHICEMSGVGAVARAADIPLSDDLRAAFPTDALTLAASGGEDYELILIGPAATLRQVPGTTIIGEISAGEATVRLIDAGGREVRLPAAGWDHLRTP